MKTKTTKYRNGKKETETRLSSYEINKINKAEKNISIKSE